MNRDNATASNGDTENVRSIIAAANLHVTGIRDIMRDMMLAVQPLTIDGIEICSDTVLAELVTYRTADQMARETETLKVKKETFGAFESSMTPIPKYCFKAPDRLKVVLVHPVADICLDDVLNMCEKEYPRPYAYCRFLWYADWIRLVGRRIRERVRPEGKKILRAAAEMVRCLLPAPERISRSERKAFAMSILHCVLQHHRSGIYHDCISEKTLFFHTPRQPLFLSNYSGVPASMLQDTLPPELMNDEAVSKYGPQYRDVYCLALICYRIMTGEHIDGKNFTLESPRPAGTVIGEIIRKNQFSFCFTTLSDALRTARSAGLVAKQIFGLTPRLFSATAFPAWRRINCASGGLWRSIPVIGPLCDVAIPTQCARAMRYILDKNWLSVYFFRNKPAKDPTVALGPDIKTLYTAFRTGKRAAYNRFESMLDNLINDFAVKRKAFGSIMESALLIKSGFRRMLDPKWMIPAFVATTVLIAAITILYMVSRQNKPSVVSSSATIEAAAEAVQSSRNFTTADTGNLPTSALPAASSGLRAQSVKAVTSAIDPKSQPSSRERNKTPIRNESAKNGDSTLSARPQPPVDTGNEQSVKTDSIAPPARQTVRLPEGYLYPVKGEPLVFKVQGVVDSCNPGRLYPTRRGRRDTVMISRTAEPPQKLFLARRIPGGFDRIITVRLCPYDWCDKTMYYEAMGLNGIGRPFAVSSGDLVALNRIRLRIYINSKQ